MATLEEIGHLFDFLRRRKMDYCHTFKSLNGQRVLKDLASFCRANSSVFNSDQRLTDVQIGRNEVWLRINEHLHLSPEDLVKLYAGLDINLSTAPTHGDAEDDQF
jgi:hypothetical protein